MRFLLIAVLCLFSLPAKATTIDLFTSPQINGPYNFAGPCYCGWGFATGYFAVTPGDTVNFGVLTIGSMWTTGPSPSGIPYPISYVNFELLVNYDETQQPWWVGNYTFGNFSVTYDLTNYLIPDDVDHISFRWLGTHSYVSPEVTAAVPEPSTWIMMLLGFAGLAAYRVRYSQMIKIHHSIP